MHRRNFLSTLVTAAAALPLRNFAAINFPETIRIGLIGIEQHYSDITSATKTIPNLQFTAICDPSETRLKSANRNAVFAKAATFTDYRKMLAAEKFDIVGVCGENGLRAEILRACAERVPAIISEKPLALTLSDLAAVRKAIERHNTALTMLLTMRFTPIYAGMRQIVQSGDIGEVIAMDAQKSYKLGERPDWMKSRKTFGGTIPYIGVHMMDLMQWITGRQFTEVSAFQSVVGDADLGEMENVTALAFKLDNNGVASLRMDYQRPETANTHGDDRLRIVGTKGIVEYQAATGLTLITQSKPARQITDLPKPKPLSVDFIESVYGGAPHQLTRAEIFRLSEIILKSRAAAEARKIVRL
ncbi:MAG TPA: Gfo/Idh/MocA family oxidoreductase [Verrucomicrobiae bacterium]|nr:Gfo/Idh/MocA family oxidoreductase [Verrucomicrobiae bacterium]